MELSALFRPSDFVVGFRPSDKWDAIERLMAHLVEAGRVSDEHAGDFLERVLERERSMSTGMERGIAIPHAAVDGLEEVVACVGVVGREEGLAFESIDGRPAFLVVLLLIPRAQKLLHIRTLADIARVLGQASVREELRATESAEGAWSILSRADVQAR